MTPNLVRYYQEAVRRVYNTNAIVPERYNGEFLRLEIELMSRQISTKHYAEAQAIMWKSWVDKLHLRHVPLNVFLSTAAKTRYNKLLSKPSIELILGRESETLVFGLMFERQFAEWYLNQVLYKTGVEDELAALNSFLDIYNNEHLLSSWLDYCDNFGRSHLVRQVINQYTNAWYIAQVCTNYYTLACRYVERQNAIRRNLRRKIKNLNYTSREFKQVSNALDKVESELESLRHGLLL